jgi:hypothetical protein
MVAALSKEKGRLFFGFVVEHIVPLSFILVTYSQSPFSSWYLTPTRIDFAIVFYLEVIENILFLVSRRSESF